jgi:hypothetical protein
MLVAHVVAVGSLSVVVGRGGSKWTLANAESVGTGRLGRGFQAEIDGEMEPRRWITLFAIGVRRRLRIARCLPVVSD